MELLRWNCCSMFQESGISSFITEMGCTSQVIARALTRGIKKGTHKLAAVTSSIENVEQQILDLFTSDVNLRQYRLPSVKKDPILKQTPTYSKQLTYFSTSTAYLSSCFIKKMKTRIGHGTVGE